MKLHCNTCGNEERFTALEETLQTVVLDGVGDAYDWKDSEVQDTRQFMCGKCDSEDIVDLETGEEMNADLLEGEDEAVLETEL